MAIREAIAILLKKAEGRRGSPQIRDSESEFVGNPQEADGIYERLDGDSDPNQTNTPCRRWGFIPLWQETEVR
ncbi:hypothetical protein CEN46_23000 [Fischerella thermalis CCMEE 5318]|uniref:Uncharacterized protein n=1 Tax=Fischerella thermalis CCMEE 5318 TaxID=2019666 RepID=A0A2N6L6T7_9CYAN|nr:hypothetical protein CEN46_23000 [Fischerella thermalis CCMEE 5318]